MLHNRSPRSVRIAAVVSIALVAAAVVVLIEWEGAGPQAEGVKNAQLQSDASRAQLPHPMFLKIPARSPTQPAEDERTREAGQLSNSPPNAVTAGSAAPVSQTQHPGSPGDAQHPPADQQNTRRPVDGVAAAKAIDWDKVKDFAPIPRSLPTRQAVDAVDAGFVPEWFDHSIGRWTTRGGPIDGKVNAIEITPWASRIISESKSSDDTWAQGVESRLRSIIASNLPGDEQVVSRVFCSSQGCLCYLEDTDLSKQTRSTQEVTRSTLNDPQIRAYGITSQTLYITGTLGWDLILILRIKPSVQ